jgi:hypothetical protein
MEGISPEELHKLYNWVDSFKLSRSKKNFTRDFSDGGNTRVPGSPNILLTVLAAEILKQLYPKYVELHNYTAVNSQTQKNYNWNTLNRKYIPRENFQILPREGVVKIRYCTNEGRC